ncbi:MAG: ATP-binding protein [Thermoplasmata archaeon]|nr:ATP-binding protein [Thermoplasmata archaeon]
MRDELVRGQYLGILEALRSRPDDVKIVTGVRRSGKSTVLKQFKRRLEASGEDVVMVDAERMRPEISASGGLLEHVRKLMPSSDCCVLLDEAQAAPGWEGAARALRDGGANVIIAGSNGAVLSDVILKDPSIGCSRVHMLPLSFREFLEMNPPVGEVQTGGRFDQYLAIGGMPSLSPDGPCWARLEDIWSSIAIRDMGPGMFPESQAMRETSRFLFEHVGTPVTQRDLKGHTGVSSGKTARKCLDSVTGSFAFHRIRTVDLTADGTECRRSVYYAADTGLRNCFLGRADTGTDALRNVVFLELIRRGYSVSCETYRDYKVDFVAERDGSTEFIQIASGASTETAKNRIERPLKLLGSRGNATVLTMDRDMCGDRGGILYRNIVDFLLEGEYADTSRT